MMVRDSITRTEARTPGAEGNPPSMAVHDRVLGPTQCGTTEADHEVHERRMQTKHEPVYAGSRHRRRGQPTSRIGETPPYGRIGRVEETTVAFEARVRASTLPD